MSDGRVWSRAETHPTATDPRLRGRTYAISFDRVWTVSLSLAGGRLPRWRVLHSDDEKGTILAEVTSAIWGRPSEVRIRIGLDHYGLTRVDLRSALQSVVGFGTNARRLGRFLQALDSELAAEPTQILDATRPPRLTTSSG